MKVLVNAVSARKGGILTYTANLMRSFHARGIDAVFAVPTEFPKLDLLPVIVCESTHYSPIRRLAWDQLVWPRIVRDVKPDVLFSSANFGLLRSPVPQVLLLREGGLFDPYYLVNIAPTQGLTVALVRFVRRWLIMQSAKAAEHAITPTEAMRAMCLEWMPEIADRCTVNLYGTLPETFSPAPRRRQWREDGILRLLYVSVYYPHKNPGTLIRALKMLNDAGIKVHATITMTEDEVCKARGAALDGALLQEAMQAGTVTLGHYPYDGLPDLYGSHDVFVFPSVSETFGHPMVEALSMGCPVVAADIPVNREVCGDAALYFEPFSASGLVKAIMRLQEEQEMREAMAARGRNRVLENFAWESHVGRLLDAFEQVGATGKT